MRMSSSGSKPLLGAAVSTTRRHWTQSWARYNAVHNPRWCGL